jgi:hypothetical protein
MPLTPFIGQSRPRPGTESVEALAERYDVVFANVYAFKDRKKPRLPLSWRIRLMNSRTCGSFRSATQTHLLSCGADGVRLRPACALP